MNIEENRLKTFAEWPANAAVDAARIAKAGFFYTGRSVEVQCFLCGTIISEWNYGDQAMARHRQAGPSCPFVQNPNDTCNVPLVPGADNNVPTASSSSTETSIRYAGEDPHAIHMRMRCQNPLREFGTVAQRLSSFAQWPKSNVISPEVLAEEGFYYLQWKDMVECAFCGCLAMNLTSTAELRRMHSKMAPKCILYVEQSETDNLDLSNVIIRPGTTKGPAELGIQAHSAPKTQKYATYEERLKTFAHWKDTVKQTPEMLARAGFYYAGFGDNVLCFYCDGGLSNWDATDDAWMEHAKWFPKCGYVNLVQGRDFVKQCIHNRPPLDPSIFAGIPEDGNAGVVETPAASVSTVVAPQEITDSALERLLHSPVAMAALEVGLHVGRVKRALKSRMERTGLPYGNADQLIKDVLCAQTMEDYLQDNPGNQTPDSPSTELVDLLNHVTTEQSNNAARSPNDLESTSTETALAKSRTKNACSSNELKPEAEPKNEDAPEVNATNSKPTDSTFLEEENRRLREARLCKVCMDLEVSVVFLPCGHLSTCVYCAPSLTYCPMCRQEIRAVVRTFVS